MALDQDTVDSVLAHVNADHAAESLTIVRAHGCPAATSAGLTSFDEHGATWHGATWHGATWHGADGYAEAGVRISWPSGPLHERAEIRRGVVALYAAARASLGEGA